MKNRIYKNFLMISLMLFSVYLTSCDDIDEPYKYPDYGYDTTGVETGKTITDTTGKKVVLLEDYTGHKCVNCPKAHIEAHRLIEKYVNQLVVVAVHVGDFAIPDGSGDFTYDFRVLPTCNDWADVFGISGLPVGTIDRKQYNGRYYVTYPGWDAKITDIVNETPKVNLKIHNIINNDRYSTKIETEFKESVTGDYKLIVCVIEDSIIKPQKNSDPTIGGEIILEYRHDHVLRSVNTTWGIPIGTNNISAGTKFKNWVGIKLKSDARAKKSSVVAFIYDANTYQVLQAAMAPLDTR